MGYGKMERLQLSDSHEELCKVATNDACVIKNEIVLVGQNRYQSHQWMVNRFLPSQKKLF